MVRGGSVACITKVQLNVDLPDGSDVVGTRSVLRIIRTLQTAGGDRLAPL